MNNVFGQPGSFGVSGTALSDWLYSGSDPWLFDGGKSKDVFAFTGDSGNKYILDFEDGSDLIDLSAYGVTSFADIDVSYYKPELKSILTLENGVTIYVHEMRDGELAVIDSTDFIYADTPVYEYSAGFDSVDITKSEYAVHLGNGGSNWLNLKALVRGKDTATEGALVKMDADELGNGTFTVKGETQHFFDFNNIRGTNGKDTMFGGEGDDNFAGLNNADELHGGCGNDRLFGNRGSDKLYGDDGDDVLNGGDGYDKLWGGEGADTFVFVSYDTRRDLVLDYENDIDLLDISQWGAASVDDLEITQLSRGRIEIATADASHSFELRSQDGPLSVSNFDDTDFIFV